MSSIHVHKKIIGEQLDVCVSTNLIFNKKPPKKGVCKGEIS